MRTRRLHALAAALLAALFGAAGAPPARAYIEAPYSMGMIVNLSTNITQLRVEKVDKAYNLIIFHKVRDLKGGRAGDVVKHNIARAGYNTREWQALMDWAEPGKTAVMFDNGMTCETCIGDYWYEAVAGGEWWHLLHGEPYLLRSYCGDADRLAGLVTDMLAGKEVVVTCMADGDKDALHFRRGRLQRMKAGLSLEYNPERDFVGWSSEGFRPTDDMPGFSHYAGLPAAGPDALAVSCPDIDGDGRPDVCLAGAGRVAVLKNGGDSFDEVAIPGLADGCRAAVWADYNGDGKPDLLLATPDGPKLYTNLGDNHFRDDSRLLPRQPSWDLTAAAWIDYDGDGRPDILLGNGFHGLLLYRNNGAAGSAAVIFEDVSEAVGLGANGIGSAVKGDGLIVCDVNGDGRPDFLYSAGDGLLVLNTPQGFVEAKDCGISYRAGEVRPAFGDCDNDGLPDLFVPQQDGCKLFHNEGHGKFADVTAKAGLERFAGWATSAAWGDVDNDGKLDLVVGVLRGPNRFFRNNGDGTFTDATEAIGLNQRIFNTQAVGLVDLNGDGVLDMVFHNEGQESCVLLRAPRWAAGRAQER